MARRMTGKQLNDRLSELGYSQIGFARRIAVDPRTVRHWISGTFPVPGAVALLLELMKRFGLKNGDLETRK